MFPGRLPLMPALILCLATLILLAALAHIMLQRLYPVQRMVRLIVVGSMTLLLVSCGGGGGGGSVNPSPVSPTAPPPQPIAFSCPS